MCGDIMAFKTNQFQQMNLFDPLYSMSERNKRFLQKSWANDFANIVFPAINEERFSVLYSDNAATRPNTPVNVTVGALLIKEMFGHTDEEFLETLLFDIRYQYTLHTTGCDEQPISDRTFSRFRERLLAYERETGIDLLKQEMYALAKKFQEFLSISPSVKRMDSIMIASSCKTMSRLELFYSCVSAVVKTFHRLGADHLLGGFEHYMEEDDKNDTIYRCKPENAEQRLLSIAQDAVRLLAYIEDMPEELVEFQNLKRLVSEQIVLNDNEVKLETSKNISTDSLQNPSDPDASYRYKAGKKHTGYVGNFVETIDEHGAIITQYDYQKNIHADHSFCEEVIDEMGMQANKVTLIADGAYSGMDNVAKAQENNIELITTALTGPAPSDIHNGFKIDREKHEVLSCPMGHQPEYYNHNEKRDDYRIIFAKEHCENCPNRDKCKAKIQQKNAVVKISQNMVDRANYIKSISTAEYIELQKKRNGVEGIPSILRRRYNVDRIPVRGFLASKLWFSLKIGAININRLLKAIIDQVHFMKFSKFIINLNYIFSVLIIYVFLSALLTP